MVAGFLVVLFGLWLTRYSRWIARESLRRRYGTDDDRLARWMYDGEPDFTMPTWLALMAVLGLLLAAGGIGLMATAA